jgi:hypothetical protein
VHYRNVAVDTTQNIGFWPTQQETVKKAVGMQFAYR